MNAAPYISPEALSQYLAGTMDAAQKAQLDEACAQDPFLADAVEGLSTHGDAALLAELTQQINRQLRLQVAKRRKIRKGRNRQLPNYKFWISILVFLALVVVAYFAIMKLR